MTTLLRFHTLFLGMALAATMGTPAQAAGKPDLTVSKLAVGDASVSAGDKLPVTDSVRNAGKARAGKSIVNYYLSRDKRRDAKDVRLAGARVVRSLTPKKTSKGKSRLKVPVKTTPGAWVLLACADGAGKVKESAEGNNCRALGGSVGIVARANPLSVTPVVDPAGRPVSVVLGPEGGRVGTTSADSQTNYVLTIPAKALQRTTRITATPLKQVDGLPFSAGMIAGVQFEPSGLQLARAATLTVIREGMVPTAAQTALGYNGPGTDLHLKPILENPPGYPANAVTIPVTHFSGDVVTTSTPAELAAQQARTPTSVEDRILQRSRDALSAERECQLAGGAAGCSGKDTQDELRKAFREYHDQVVKPQMTAAETNDVLLQQAASDFFGWARQLALLGMDGEFEQEYQALLKSLFRAIDNAYKKAKERCFAGDFTQISRLIGIERTRQLLGSTEADGPSVFEDIDKCVRFELRFESKMLHRETPAGEDYYINEYHVKATVPLRTADLGQTLTGEGPIEIVSFKHDSQVASRSGYTCKWTGLSAVGGTFKVQAAEIDFGIVEGKQAKPPVVIGTLIDPGRVTMQVRQQCSGGGVPPSDNTDPGELFLDEWALFHRPDKVTGPTDAGDGVPDAWLIDGYQRTTDVFGRRLYNATLFSGVRQLDETYEIVHVPDRS